MKKLLSLLATGYILFSCNERFDLEYALSIAGENRTELEKVLDYYSHDPVDSLKYRAAEFLIENLPYHYSYEGKIVDNYIKLYELHGTGKYSPEEVLDSITSTYGRFDYNRASIKVDTSIDPNYLTDNIEWAFKVWREQPWGKNVTFENFCEYILPYRVGNERLTPWRENIYNQFNPLLDSIRMLPEAEDPLFVSRIVLRHLKSIRPFYFSHIFNGPSVGPENVNWYSGYCRESSDVLIYVLRALGIPCGRDYMVVRGDNNEGHEWNFVLDKNGDSHFCSITYASNEPEATSTYWWSKGKVNRQTFSLNRDIMALMNADAEDVHPLFRYPHFVDATRLYTGERNHSVTIPREKFLYQPRRGETIYLCSSSRREWIPLGVSSYSSGRDSIRFNDVEGGVVFRLATYRQDKLASLTPPFLLDKETGGIRYFEPGDEMEDVVLFHKFNLDWVFPWNMVGGVFEASNGADFSVRDTLFVVRDKPQRMWNVVKLSNEKKYRYLRYIGPAGSHCDVAEVAFYRNYSDTIPMRGMTIGTPNTGELKITNDYTNVFDGDTKTSFTYDLPEGGWAGQKLKEAEKIEKIVYTARNRDNFIQKGNLYELFYDKNGLWVSAGAIQAASDSLFYNVPKGSLLYLKNHTQGKDERIFEINERFNNIEQIFW